MPEVVDADSGGDRISPVLQRTMELELVKVPTGGGTERETCWLRVRVMEDSKSGGHR